jgi:uncharacterized protein
MGCPVVHFEITGKDAKRTQEFYGQLFGWEIEHMPEMDYGLVKPPDGVGIGGGVTGATDRPSSVTVYVAVDDLQRYLDKAVAMGAKTIVPPTTVPGMVSFALFTDPDGNLMGIVHNQIPPK